MKVINFIAALFIRARKPVFGNGIFTHRTWLSRQVEEAQYKRAFNLD